MLILRPSLLLPALLLWPIPATGAPPAMRAVARAAGDSADLVAYAESGRVLVQASGRRVDVDAPPTARVHALARLGAGWLVAGTAPTAGGGTELWLRRGESGVTAVVAPPSGRSAGLRHDAVPLADSRNLLGVAWLEGDSRETFEVRFAPWSDNGFGAPQVVARRGRGSQLALAGARLADGRLLLVWAGYDGQDDEIWASLGDGRTWTAPLRVAGDNRVPDITPDVVAHGSGALVAWSRFDGSEYQAVVASFDGVRFRAPIPAAEPGSLFPTFEGAEGRRGLLFSDARRSGWALVELDAQGSPFRTSRLDFRNEGERPVVRLGDRGVEWSLGLDREATAWE